MHEPKDESDEGASNRHRKAVVIGGAGFLGKRLVTMLGGGDGSLRAAAANGRASTTCTSWIARPTSKTRRRKQERETRGIWHLVGDRRHPIEGGPPERPLRGAHTVFHLASLVDVGLRRNPAIEETNVVGTRNVIEVCQELGVPFLVYTSSEDVVFSETPVSGGDESLPYPAKAPPRVRANEDRRASARYARSRRRARPSHLRDPAGAHLRPGRPPRDRSRASRPSRSGACPSCSATARRASTSSTSTTWRTPTYWRPRSSMILRRAIRSAAASTSQARDTPRTTSSFFAHSPKLPAS